MSDESDEPKVIKHQGKSVFTICGCKATIVTAPDGKRHIEADCPDKSARDEAAAIFEEEILLRVNPKIILEDAPATES